MAARLIEFGEEVGTQVPVMAACDCSAEGRPRRLPVWLHVENTHAIARLVRGILRDDLVVMTYKCRCGRKVALTIGDLFAISNDEVSKSVS